MTTDGFTVKSMCGCRVVFGPVPMSEFGMLAHGFSKSALIAADIADRIGATIVIGEPDDLDELRKANLPASEKRHAQARSASAMPLVAGWLLNGERGNSSNAMCKRIFGVPEDAGKDYPLDPDDLRRCVLFLAATNAHDKVPLMADVSKEWAALVGVWDKIVSTLREEMDTRRSDDVDIQRLRHGVARDR